MSSSVIMRGHYATPQSTFKTEKSVSKLKQCTCCPYGYHIDLDFVNYCEQLAANTSPQSDEQRQRRDKRRQRKSMEVMLGVGEQLLQNYSHQPRTIHCIPILKEANESDSPAFREERSPYEEFYNSCDFECHEIERKVSTFEMQEKTAFVKDILFDVCSDFERTFERTKKRTLQEIDRYNFDDVSPSRSNKIGKCISKNEPIDDSFEDLKTVSKTRSYTIDQLDSHDERLRHEPISPQWDRSNKPVTTKTSSQIDKSKRSENLEEAKEPEERGSNIQLQNIRQQMALSLSRMRDLEEQVKLIPKLRLELSAERAEKQNLHTKLKEIEDCHVIGQISAKSEEISAQPPTLSKAKTPPKTEDKFSTKPFSTQRVCATSLESLNIRFQNSSSPTFSLLSQNSVNNSTSSGTPSIPKSTHSQRDVGCMTYSPLLRDVGTITVNQLPKRVRTVGTNTQLISQDVNQPLFTDQDVQRKIHQAIDKYQKEIIKSKQSNYSTVGVQCSAEPKQLRHMGTVTDRPKTPPPPPPCLRHSVGIMAVVDTRNAFSTAKPETKTIALDNIAANVKTRSSGTDPIKHLTDVTEPNLSSVEKSDQMISLKSLDMVMSTSSNLSHSSDKDIKETIKIQQSNASTQCSFPPPESEKPELINQTSVAVQHSPRQASKYSQCISKANSPPRETSTKQCRTESTDTRDLVRLQDRSNNTEAPPKKRDRLTNTDRIRTVNESTNTTAIAKTVESGTNPDVGMISRVNEPKSMPKVDVGLGTDPVDVIAKNCTTCLAKIEIKQQTLIKTTAKPDDTQHSQDSSRIPRPTALISPRSERKFHRQNTYTVTPTPSPESEAERRSWLSENIAESSLSNDAMISELIAETVTHATCPAETYLRITTASRESSPIKHRNPSENATASAGPSTSGTSTQVNGSATVSAGTSSREAASLPCSSAQPSTSRPRQTAKPSKEMQAALKVINDSLQKSNQVSANLRNANKIVQKEWFRVSSTESAQPLDVEDFLDYFEELSTNLLKYVVNLSDANGNTAMHYAISHGNFDVVSILLDSKVCCVNQTNNAGYTCVMLVSLAKLVSAEHHTVVQRLFQMSDVNIRAKKHNQTALMLAVSHGNYDMVQLLLEAGADINIQDEDGSTALMCAAEHGRIDIIKLLLAQPDCDSTIQDVDGSSALKISLEAGYRDIGVLLYAHEHMSRNKSPYASLRRSTRSKKLSSSLSSSTTTLGGATAGSSSNATKQTP